MSTEVPRRRRPAIQIDTQRRLEASDDTVATFVNRKRDARLWKGRMCLYCFMSLNICSLIGVASAKQYTLAYYGWWCAFFLSLFFLWPAVLPTDNAEIGGARRIAVGSLIFGAVVAAGFARRKFRALDQCKPLWLCRCNVAYWVIHVIIPTVGLTDLWTTRCFAPQDVLNRIWWLFGWYGKLCVGIGTVDLIAETIAGKYDSPTMPGGLRLSFYGKFAVGCSMLAIGRLSHCHSFKVIVWRYAASHATIFLLQDSKTR